ncbi:hypothetical protein DPEC_G00291410 [Dallia pectoralis]|uniref:Uncharacterized protein n=1 Tax=Dallia pectoralis TaxID=75939 RepID=A0ACC2FHU0_DALPE|nr:hypothetical protein DPEC_G00291410 [Dallia pectoralis]
MAVPGNSSRSALAKILEPAGTDDHVKFKVTSIACLLHSDAWFEHHDQQHDRLALHA